MPTPNDGPTVAALRQTADLLYRHGSEVLRELAMNPMATATTSQVAALAELVETADRLAIAARHGTGTGTGTVDKYVLAAVSPEAERHRAGAEHAVKVLYGLHGAQVAPAAQQTCEGGC